MNLRSFVNRIRKRYTVIFWRFAAMNIWRRN